MNRTKDTLSLMNWWIVIPFFVIGFTYTHENITFRSQLILGPIVFLVEWLKCRRILKGLPERITIKEIKEYQRSDYSHKWASARDQRKGIISNYSKATKTNEA